jgi:hypothetical protein
VVPLNQPVVLKLSIKASALALDNGLSDVEFATLGLPTGIDVFTLPAGVTVNAPGSFLVDNRFVPPTPDISVAPTSYDFGNVNLGSSANTLVTISNTGGLDLTVSGIGLENGSSSAIAVTQAPALPAVIHPGGTVDIQLTYTPTTTLGDQAILDVTSGRPRSGRDPGWLGWRGHSERNSTAAADRRDHRFHRCFGREWQSRRHWGQCLFASRSIGRVEKHDRRGRGSHPRRLLRRSVRPAPRCGPAH